MTEHPRFHTLTMAQLHARQGNIRKAAEIYRFLLEKEPDRQDLVDALGDIETRLLEKSEDRLAFLFEQWLDLSFAARKIRRLRQLKNNCP